MLQNHIPFLPEGAKPINDHVAIYCHDDQIEFYTASGPIYSCSKNDPYGFRLAQGIIASHTTVSPAQLGKALEVDRSTIYRNLKKYEKEGPGALIIDKSNRQAYKLNAGKCRKVQGLLNKGYTLKAAANEVGVTEGCIRHGIKKGKIIAIEKKSERLAQIKNNQKKFGVGNLKVVQAELPAGLDKLPRPDRIFIGGGGRQLKSIITAAAQYLKPEGGIVVNTVLIPNVEAARATMEGLDFSTEIIQVQINRSRPMPWADRLEALNPVWIISGFRI